MALWKRLQAALVRLGIARLVIAFIAGIVAAAHFGAAFPDWTGFGPPPLDAQGKELPHAKTLWDWLQLMGVLLVPAVLAVGGYLFTRAENDRARSLQDRREAEARRIETERAQDAALQAYLDQMTQLLLHEKLRTSPQDDEVRSVARARTLTVLRVLDGERKARVLQFLYEARLIGGIKQEEGGVSGTIDAIVSLEGANLYEANLFLADLGGANLAGANLNEAYLHRANLIEANLAGAQLIEVSLQGANLRGAMLEGLLVEVEGMSLQKVFHQYTDLGEANLQGADLTGCEVTREQLAQARSLEGAKLPFDMTPPAPIVEEAPPQNGQPQPPASEAAPQNGQSQQKADQHADTKHE